MKQSIFTEMITNMDAGLLASMGLAILSLIFLLKCIFSFSSEFVNYASHKKRLKQLKFNNRGDLTSKELIEGVTNVVDDYIFKGQEQEGLSEIEKKLVMAGWDRTFDPLQYKAVNLALKIGSLIILIVLIPFNIWLAIFMSIIPFFSLDILLRNDVNNKKENILNNFPELISVIQGYVEAGIPLIEAIAYAIPFSGEAWSPLLKKMVLDAEINGIEYALDELKRKVDILEVKEFASLIKLAQVQGSNVIESFEAQAKRMAAIKYQVGQMKIQKRRTMGVLVQMPMLLMVFVAFGLPLVPQVTTMLGSM